MADVISFPGAGIPPAPALPADLDAIGDRYTALLEARERGDARTIRLLSAACADDVPALVDEIARVEALRVELARHLDRIYELHDLDGNGV